MTAYSFKRQFIALILAGTKKQTIRALRKGRSRHARPGDELQLYTAMRTKFCTLIGRAICVSADPIILNLAVGIASITHVDGWMTKIWPHGMDEFAQADGFANFLEMRLFWTTEHPDVLVFDGVLIRWSEFRPAMETPT